MNDRELNLRQVFAIAGLVCVAPGTFWNWGLLLVALVFLFLSRRVR